MCHIVAKSPITHPFHVPAPTQAFTGCNAFNLQQLFKFLLPLRGGSRGWLEKEFVSLAARNEETGETFKLYPLQLKMNGDCHFPSLFHFVPKDGEMCEFRRSTSADLCVRDFRQDYKNTSSNF